MKDFNAWLADKGQSELDEEAQVVSMLGLEQRRAFTAGLDLTRRYIATRDLSPEERAVQYKKLDDLQALFNKAADKVYLILEGADVKA